MRVCVACDTEGLTISGLFVARYLSLCTRCGHDDAIRAIKIAHESFMPLPYAQTEFLATEFDVCTAFDTIQWILAVQKSIIYKYSYYDQFQRFNAHKFM